MLKKTIQRIKANHPDYGYRRVHACLPGVNHIVESWLNMASFKVCREKGIAWITPQWKVSLDD
nr:transposase [Haemophilus influenzae]